MKPTFKAYIQAYSYCLCWLGVVIILCLLLFSCSKERIDSPPEQTKIMWTSVTDRYDIKTFQFYKRDTVSNWYYDKWIAKADSVLPLPQYNWWGRYCSDTPHWVIHQFQVRGFGALIPPPFAVPDSTVQMVLLLE